MASERLSQRLSRYWMIVLLVLASFTVAGCAAIAGIFKAGVWTGVVMVVILLGIIGFMAARIRG
jgi:fatty acid desaturase